MSESPDTIKLDVWFSEEQAADLHAAHKKYGCWMSVAEYRLRKQAEKLGFELVTKPATR